MIKPIYVEMPDRVEKSKVHPGMSIGESIMQSVIYDAIGGKKECPTCGEIKESNPTPDGDEICPSCGDREMMDWEAKREEQIENEVNDLIEKSI